VEGLPISLQPGEKGAERKIRGKWGVPSSRVGVPGKGQIREGTEEGGGKGHLALPCKVNEWGGGKTWEGQESLRQECSQRKSYWKRKVHCVESRARKACRGEGIKER